MGGNRDAPAEGTQILGKYVVKKTIGRGGMGFVVLAEHLQLGSNVAIKYMMPFLAENEAAADRFLREAKIAASLTNPHVVRVIDVDVDDSGTPFMAMEYLDGTPLDRYLEKEGMLSPQTLIDISLQVCDALEEAHAKGIVHRDLKPANVFLSKQWDGTSIVKVLDFGISKASSREEPTLTQDGDYLGSPNYMAPEQLESSRSVDHRADIWSWGVCMYRALTGVLPFDSPNVWEVMLNVKSKVPKNILDLRPDVTPALAKVVEDCITRSLDERTQDVAQLRAALENVQQESQNSLESPASTPRIDPQSQTLRFPVNPLVGSNEHLTQEVPTERDLILPKEVGKQMSTEMLRSQALEPTASVRMAAASPYRSRRGWLITGCIVLLGLAFALFQFRGAPSTSDEDVDNQRISTAMPSTTQVIPTATAAVSTAVSSTPSSKPSASAAPTGTVSSKFATPQPTRTMHTVVRPQDSGKIVPPKETAAIPDTR